MTVKLYRVNKRRFLRGAEAVQYDCDGELLWMSERDIKKNLMSAPQYRVAWEQGLAEYKRLKGKSNG